MNGKYWCRTIQNIYFLKHNRNHMNGIYTYSLRSQSNEYINIYVFSAVIPEGQILFTSLPKAVEKFTYLLFYMYFGRERRTQVWEKNLENTSCKFRRQKLFNFALDVALTHLPLKNFLFRWIFASSLALERNCNVW